MASRIYTRSGDHGTTGLADGRRIEKDSWRIEAIGAVDELNASLGLVAAYPEAASEQELLARIQATLFELGAELAGTSSTRITAEVVSHLERSIDRIDARLPPITRFILPGGSQAGAACHFARTVCRRAERELLSLARRETVNSQSIVYLNRLSDLLFVLARDLVRQGGGKEIYWQSS